MNRQARLANTGTWFSFGEATHSEAARMLAKELFLNDVPVCVETTTYDIESRCDSVPNVLQRTTVKVSILFETSPQRGDENQ